MTSIAFVIFQCIDKHLNLQWNLPHYSHTTSFHSAAVVETTGSNWSNSVGYDVREPGVVKHSKNPAGSICTFH